jgi:hypothetical protein
MGERGHTVHVLDGKIGEGLARIGPVAVLGSNERWTTFVPSDASTFDASDASKVLDRPLVHVWFDDDGGVSSQVYASGDFVGELSLPSDEADVTESDLAFAEKLEDLGILSRVQRAALLKRISNPAGLREWTMKHGLEKLLELPFYDPMPVLEAEKKPRKAKAEKAKARTTASSPKESWTEKEIATVDLHREYWATVFSMNNWKLYNRYKKHLPADRRREVDELCNAVAMGDDEQVRQLVKGILARIWSCEDWDAIIRAPALVDGDEDAWVEWLARLASSS